MTERPALDLKRLQALCDLATPEPWKTGRTDLLSYLGDGTPVLYVYRPNDTSSTRIPVLDRIDDAKFIVAAREAMPKLIARLVALEREREEDRQAIRWWLDYLEPYFKETSLLKMPWRMFRDWKKEHAAAIARAQERP